MRRHAVLVGLLFAVLATPAFAVIAPQHGIRGVTVGMSPAQVKSTLGSPVKTARGTNDFGAWVEYRYQGLTVSFQSGTGATTITALTAAEKTATGVGIGSTIEDVILKVAGSKCLLESGYEHCYVGRWTPGQIVTDFSLKSGHVSRVVVGRVLD